VAAERGPAQRFTLHSDITRIGRDSAADIFLTDPSVSKQHAEIVYNAEGFHIVDRDSDQGTYLDGVAARLARIEHLSYLRFGKVQALFALRRRGEEPPEASFRLRDHLLASFPEKREQVQEVFRACRQRPIDFVEELVARGVLDPEEWWAASRDYRKGSTGLLGNPSRWLSRLFAGRERRQRNRGADR
jgi:pSer/pThr/pTyr-binding forkhead associated (FHA) protein